MRSALLVAAAATALGVTSAQATLLVYDGFDYTAGALNGVAAPLNAGSNSGFATGSSYAASATDVQPGSLFYAGTFTAGSGIMPSVGGKIRGYIGGSGTGVGADGAAGVAQGGRPFGLGSTATVPAAPTAGTYYYSFLWSNGHDGTTPSGYFNVLGVASASGNLYQGGIGLRFTGGNFSSNNTDGGAGMTTITGVTYPAGSGANQDKVYLIVGKVVINTANPYASTNQIWVNPDTFTAGGAISGGFAGPVETFGTYGTAGVKLSMTARTNGSGNGWLVDEVRIGTSLADVVAIPEPATLGLLGLGCLGLLRRRKQA